MSQQIIIDLSRQAIREDIAHGDHTTLACISPQAKGMARLLVKQEGILAGVEVASLVFHETDPELVLEVSLNDGSSVRPGDIAFTVSGSRASILQAERLVLNFMQRMSGIATHTRQFVEAVEGTGAIILDTRKTTPNFRIFEKMAVKTGGGANHRMGLYDMIMIKDNHVDFSGSIAQALSKTKEYLIANKLTLKIEVEARNIDEVNQILQAGGADRILLDNMSTADLARCVELIGHTCETEASGGITLDNVKDIALTGVNFISVGALTHQIKSLDLSLKASNI